MTTNRRQFIRNAGIGSIGWSLLPSMSSLASFAGVPFALPRTSPEAQGVSSVAIKNFIQAASTANIFHSFMLLRHGNVIAEGWWKPFAPQYKHTLYSLSKSFTSTAIGLLVKEGKLSVDEPVSKFFADEMPATPSENLQKMKVKHLLTMNTGHGEDTTGKMREGKETWTKTFLSLPVQYEPGSHFLYNTGATYMLGAIVYKLTGQKLTDYLQPRLFQPLGITGYDWEQSPQGLNTAGYGLRVKTEDIAAFGQLYLQKGKWKDKDILTEAWVNEATCKQTTSQTGDNDWAQGYGYQFWRCKPGFYRGDGAFGQFCFVMPEQDAVLAVTSESWDMQKSMNIVYDNLLPGIKTEQLAEDAVAFASLRKDLQTLTIPVARGKLNVDTQKAIGSKKISFDKNDFGVTDARFDFAKDGGALTLKTATGDKIIRFGWENWVTGKDHGLYAFSIPGRIHVPSQIAGTATWKDDKILQIDLKFVEAIHGDKITCTFDGNNVKIDLLNTVSENAKNNPDKRQPLTGKI